MLRLALPFTGPLLLHPPDGCGFAVSLLLRRAHFFRKDVRFSFAVANKNIENIVVENDKTRNISQRWVWLAEN